MFAVQYFHILGSHSGSLHAPFNSTVSMCLQHSTIVSSNIIQSTDVATSLLKITMCASYISLSPEMEVNWTKIGLTGKPRNLPSPFHPFIRELGTYVIATQCYQHVGKRRLAGK
jgi:hypothetical protein